MSKILYLKPITIEDVKWLDKTEYRFIPLDRRKLLVQESEKGLSQGEFFRFYLIMKEKEVVGVINMCGHGKDVVSVAPEILEEYRGKGYGQESLELAYKIAKDMGFKELTAGIREENLASINLHIKLGFTFAKNQITKRGNKIKVYSKPL